MSHFHHYKQLVYVCTVLSTCGLYACGGSSTTPDSVIEAGQVVAPMQLSATIVMEERNGKTVFDGWFVQSMSADVPSVERVAQSSDDHCQFSSYSVDDVLVSSSAQTSDTPSDLKNINGSALIKSRAGAFESLVKQSAGDTTVYAPNERWQAETLPDDSVLSFDTDSIFGKMDGIDVPPLMPLVWLAPETGVMSSAAAALRWEASFNSEARINLKLSAIDFRNSENPIVTSIDCTLIDDGEFNLSAQLQQQLPDDHMGIVVYAVRERVQLIESAASMLTVVQLSYPAPIKL